MKPQIMTITPEMAKAMLKKNPKNRQVNGPNVAKLVKEMKEGRWRLNGDMIRFTEDEELVDGQHRLLAVVRSGCTIESWVMYGVPVDVFDTIDVGKRRSTADTLSCLGHKKSRALAATLILIERYMTGRTGPNHFECSNTEIESLLKKYPDVPHYLIANGKVMVGLPASIINCCFYLFSKKDVRLAQEFVDKVVRGIGLTQGDPWHVLRERLLANHANRAKLHKHHLWALCIKAWNQARKGAKINSLKLHTEEGRLVHFPVIE